MTEKIIDECITVECLGSGFAAIHRVLVKDDNGEYWDIQQTGIGRYSNSDKARIEAKQWSRDEGIRLNISE